MFTFGSKLGNNSEKLNLLRLADVVFVVVVFVVVVFVVVFVVVVFVVVCRRRFG